MAGEKQNPLAKYGNPIADRPSLQTQPFDQEAADATARAKYEKNLLGTLGGTSPVKPAPETIERSLQKLSPKSDKNVVKVAQSWNDVPDRVRSATFSAITQQVGLQGVPWTKNFAKYPAIALATARAANNGSIDPKQMKKIATAVDVMDSLMDVVHAPNDTMRKYILSRMEPNRQAAVMTAGIALQGSWDKINAEAAFASGGESPIAKFFGAGFSATMNALNWLNEQGQHYGRLTVNQLKFNTQGRSFIEQWNATDEGSFDEGTLNTLRAKYGDMQVNVAVDLLRSQHSEDQDIGSVIDKYANDPQAMALLYTVLSGKGEKDFPHLGDLFGRVNAAREDNLGGMVANSFLPEDMEGTSAAWTGISKTTNLAGIVFLDPTLVGGKIARSVKLARYGLAAFGPERLSVLLDKPKVAEFFGNVVDDIKKYNAADGAAARGTVFDGMRVKYGKFLTDEAIETLSRMEKSGKYASAELLVRDWAVSGEAYAQLMSGQTAAHGAAKLAPRVNAVRDSILDAKISLNERIGRNDVAHIMPDLTKFAEHTAAAGGDPTDFTQAFKDYSTASSRIDRMMATVSRAPEGGRILVSDAAAAASAENVYRWVRTFGSRTLANAVRETWLVADEGVRRQILGGVWKTVVDVKGVDLNRVVDGITLGERLGVPGFKTASEQYATTLTTATEALDAHPFVRLLNETEPLSRKNIRTPEAARNAIVSDTNRRLVQLYDEMRVPIEERMHLQDAHATLKEIAKDAPGMGMATDDIDALLSQIDALALELKANGKEVGRSMALMKRLKGIKQAMKDAEFGTWNPAEVSGQTHAIHLYQMRDYMTVPDLRTIQMYQAREGIIGKIIGWSLYDHSTGMVVDAWNTANLLSPRTVYRNSIEDVISHIVAGGELSSLRRGQAAARMWRDVTGRAPSIVGRIVRKSMPDDEVALLKAAIARNDTDVARQIVAKASVRVKVDGLGVKFTDDELDGVTYLMQVPGFESSMMDLTESRLRQDMQSGNAAEYVQNAQVETLYRNVSFYDDYQNAMNFWSETLRKNLHDDGPAGQIAYRMLESEARFSKDAATVARAWDRNKQWLTDFFTEDFERGGVWKQRSTMMNIVGPEEMAFRYFNDFANVFSRNGYLLRDVIDLVKREKIVNGKKRIYGVMSEKGLLDEGFVADAEEAKREADRVFFKLREFGESQRPPRVLGSERNIVAIKGEERWDQRMWAQASESMARISREPIFFSNYLNEWKTVQPEIRKMVADGLDEEAAKRIAAERALNRAMDVTVSYIDNPRVKSLLAHNVRNIARYYRATEDFYRRVGRMASYRPEGIQKINLLYNNLNTSGFVHEDENGVKYFVYPGTGVANEVVSWMLQKFQLGTAVNSPFALGGQVAMLTPSSDPQGFFPTFAGPVSSPFLKTLTAIGPFQALEPLLLGPRGTQTTASVQGLVKEATLSIVPTPFKRIWQAFEQNDRDTMAANATMAGIKYAKYAGLLEQRKDENDEAFIKRVHDQIGTISMSALITRAVFGFLVPASPQVLASEETTDLAKQLGVRTFRSGFLQLLNRHNGDYDTALGEWAKLNPDLLVYTVSGSETAGQTPPFYTTDAGKWVLQNTDFVKKYTSASAFLMPDTGGFSTQTLSLMRALGFTKGRETDSIVQDVFTASDYYDYQRKRDMIDSVFASADPSQRKGLTTLRENIRAEAIAKNPLMLLRLGDFSDASKDSYKIDALNGMRYALKFIDKERPSLASDRTKKIATMISHFDAVKNVLASLQGQSDSDIARRKEVRSILRADLARLSKDDDGASRFFDRVLDPLIG